MKRFLALALISAPAFAAITGTLIDRTTGRPRADVTVAYFTVGNGLQLVDQGKTDAKGAFLINQAVLGPGALRATVDGVTYTMMLQPGVQTSGLTFDVYDASSEPGSSKVTKHMLLFQPAGGQMAIKETYLIANDGKVAWSDSRNGTLRFYLPPASGGKAEVTATAPGSMSIGASLVKTAEADVYGVDFAIKPGETRIDLDYSLPYKEGDSYLGRIVSKDENTYLIAPNGVTLAGDHLNDLGTEPQTQSHIYGLAGAAYKIALTGTPLVAEASDDSSDSGPQVEVVNPRARGQLIPILGLALGVLAVGFAILYRAGSGTPAGKETNERGRG